jgi:hypothetical protein
MTVADPLLWHANGTPHVTEPRLAKERTITWCNRGSVPMHGQ